MKPLVKSKLVPNKLTVNPDYLKLYLQAKCKPSAPIASAMETIRSGHGPPLVCGLPS